MACGMNSAVAAKPRLPVALWIIFIFVPFALAFQAFKVDDAYISFVYAKNLVQGNGLTYNGMMVEGYSNFLWTLLMAPFIALKVDPLLAARAVSLVSAGAVLLLTERLIRQFNPGLPNWAVFLALCALALCAPFAAWAMGGLETMLMTLWVTLFVYLERSSNRNAARLSSLSVLAAALTRPEGAMLFPLLIIYRLAYKKQPLRIVLWGSLLFIVPFGFYLLWRHSTYGYWLPNTAFLKLDSGWETALKGSAWLFSYWITRPLLALLVALAAVHLFAARALFNRDWGLATLTVLAFFAFVIYAGPDWMPHYRFWVPVVPLLSVFVARALIAFTSPLYRRSAFALLASAVALEVIFAVTVHMPYAPQFGDYTDGLIRGGKWIRQVTSPQDTIAVVDAGALAYYSERRTIDILGLNDAHIAHSPQKDDPAYVLAQRPRVVQLHIAFSPAGHIQSGERDDNNWTLYKHPDFQRAYVPAAEVATDPFFPFLFAYQYGGLSGALP